MIRKSQHRTKVLAILVRCLLALAAAAGPASRVIAREFRAADTQPEDYPTVQALLYMDRLVNERTQGRHRIMVFHSHQLGEEKETIEQTRVGAIDLNRVSLGPLASFAPEANILALPFLFRSIDHLHHVLDGSIGADILKRLEAYGFIGLTFYDAGSRSIYNSVRPVRTPEDLRGLRIRVQQSELAVAMMKALGATPIALPYGQVATSLATGLVDGAENNWPSYVTTGHYRYARHISLTEHTMTPEVLLISRKAWEELSVEDQAIFRDAARDSSVFMRREWAAWEERSRAQARESGTDIVEHVDRAAFEAAVAGLTASFLTDPAMRALVERIRAEP